MCEPVSCKPRAYFYEPLTVLFFSVFCFCFNLTLTFYSVNATVGFRSKTFSILLFNQEREENNENNQLKDAITMQYQILRNKSEGMY